MPYRDQVKLVPRLLSELTGKLAEEVVRMELDPTKFMVADGITMYLDWVAKRIGMKDLAEEMKVFDNFFYQTRRDRGQTLTAYANEEENNYRKLQLMLKRVFANTDSKEAEYSTDEESTDHTTGNSGAPSNRGTKQEQVKVSTIPTSQTASRMVLS